MQFETNLVSFTQRKVTFLARIMRFPQIDPRSRIYILSHEMPPLSDVFYKSHSTWNIYLIVIVGPITNSGNTFAISHFLLWATSFQCLIAQISVFYIFSTNTCISPSSDLFLVQRNVCSTLQSMIDCSC